jgi:spermidine synthase
MSDLLANPRVTTRAFTERWTYPQIRAITFVLFLLGGFSALAYEVTWVRALSLTFGVSVYAVTAVLTAFMGGLALGSWLWGRKQVRAPLRVYACLQGGVALAAFLSPWLIDALTSVYVAIFNQLQPNFYVFNLLRFALATLVLIVPATLMGGTFPVISQFLADDRTRRGADLGLLYGVNTLGGVIGTLLTGLVLVRVLGVHMTLYLAAVIDLLVAGAALLLHANLLPAEDAPTPSASPAPSAPPKRSRRAQRQMAFQAAALTAAQPTEAQLRAKQREARIMAWAFGVSGFVALGYEVVWTRLVAIFTLNTIFSFTIMLTTFLIGLALGSVAVRGRVDRWRQPFLVFASLQLLVGLTSVLMLFVFAKLPTILTATVAVVSFGSAIAAEFIAAGVTMLVPTLLLGATFPVAAKVYLDAHGDTSGRVGRLYGINTVGSMLGSVVAGFVLIPLLGLQWSCLLLAAINILLGLAMLVVGRARARQWSVASVGLVAVVAAALLPPGVYLGFREGVIPELVFYREGIDATVSVFEVKEPPLKISFVNGRSEVPTDRDSMRAFYLLGNLPPLLRPDAQSALMVSFGNGIASGTMARHNLPRIQAVEIVAEQVAAATLYEQENRGILDYPGFSVTIEDGRNYLLRSRETFDIITADATHPISTSSWALFTQEFYGLVRGRLAADGVFVQWLPFHDLKESDYRAIIKTFQQQFPHTSLWFTGGTHTFLVATPTTLSKDDILALQGRIDQLGIADDLQSAQRLAEDFIMDEQQVRQYVADAAIVTDDRAFFVPAQDMQRILDSFVPYMEASNP